MRPRRCGRRRWRRLRPEFHLRADRLYNAPDTGFEMTEEGGLMWGETVVGGWWRGPRR
jgi:ATP-dependent RNA helicase SUPV3L1/SUV3